MVTPILTYIERVSTRIHPRTIKNFDEFIRRDLLPASHRYEQSYNDQLQLAGSLSKTKKPIFLDRTADHHQALEEFIPEWFSNSSGEYAIYVIIKRQLYEEKKIKPEPMDEAPLDIKIKKEPKQKVQVKKEPVKKEQDEELSDLSSVRSFSVQSLSVQAAQKRRLSGATAEGNPHRTRRTHRLDDEDRQRILEHGPGPHDL